MKTWLEASPQRIPDDLQAVVGGHPLLAASLVRRGIHNAEAAAAFLNPADYRPASPDAFPDMGQAVERLQKAIRKQEQILVWGDFDVDGQTSTALLVAALRDLGAKVVYHLPNRFTEGHGVFLPKLKELLAGVQVLLTCDTGISAHEAVNYAQSRGVDVIITDHHSLPKTLPNAFATINPMLLAEGHPLRELSGVGTAYKLVEALYGGQSSEHLLDLVAVGMVADVMLLKDDTRYLVQRGLDVLRNSPREAFKAMMIRAQILASDLTEMDIGFTLAPRLNALGRLADAAPIVEFLTSNDPVLIAEQVNVLEGMNQRRKFLTRQVYEAARQQIEKDPSLLKYAALIVTGADWHTGVVGIVASRLAEDYACPVLVLSEKEGFLSGSARSVAGANIIAAIESQAHLLRGYGGHNMAAGLSLDSANLGLFRRGLSQTVRESLGKAEVQPELAIDAFLDFRELNLQLAEDIARLAPFGNGNPALTLATKEVKIKSRRTMGSRGEHLNLQLEDKHGNEQRVVWWFGEMDALPEGYFDIAYTLRPNVYKGKRDAMIEWLDARVSETTLLEIRRKTYEIVDFRQQIASENLLESLKTQHEDSIMWAEGKAEGVTRYALQPAKTLIVWTSPPDILTWRTALELVQPETLILLGQEPATFKAQDFISQIIGMGKYALRAKAGLMHLSEIAALTAQSEASVLTAIRWIDANTEMKLKLAYDDAYQISLEPTAIPAQKTSLQILSKLLDESKSYRQFWMKQSFG